MSLVLPPFRRSSSGFYEIPAALELKAASRQYLTRTWGAPTNRKAWTLALWYRKTRTPNPEHEFILSVGATGQIYFNQSTDTLQFTDGGALATTRLFRDPSSFVHLCFVYDSANTTSTDRLRLYVNGVRETSFTSPSYPALNADSVISNAVAHHLGTRSDLVGSHTLDGVLADVHFIDGQALDPTAFCAFDANGKWHPKKYAETVYADSVPVMTSATAPSGIVTTNDEANGPAWRAFSDVFEDSAAWNTGAVAANPTSKWVAYEDTAPTTVVRYSIRVSASYAARGPKSWKLQGWNGSAYVDIDTRTGVAAWSASEKRTYEVSSPAAYSKHRLEVTEVQTTGTTLIIDEIELLEMAVNRYGAAGFRLDFANGTYLGKDIGNVEAATAYTNTGGSGDRTSLITVTSNVTFDSGTLNNLVDGAFSSSSVDALDAPGTGTPGNGPIADGAYLRFAFPTKVYADEVKLYFDAIQQATGAWKVQRSNDASAWTDVASFTWNAATQTVALAGVPADGFRYLQVIKDGAGSLWSNNWFREVEFRIKGLGNAWTPVNGPVQTLDTPTNVYARFDPTALKLSSAATVWSEAGLKSAYSGAAVVGFGTSFPLRGKMYVETVVADNGYQVVGLAEQEWDGATGSAGSVARLSYYHNVGDARVSKTGLADFFRPNPTPATPYTVQWAYDEATGNVWMGRNNVWFDGAGGTTGNPASGANPTYTFPAAVRDRLFIGGSNYTSGVMLNPGDKTFTYTPPSGFKAPCTRNLPKPAIADPGKHFDIALYTGNGQAGTIPTEFAPGLVWIKRRDGAATHGLFDALRGVNKALSSNATAAELTGADWLTSFLSNGFTLGANEDTNLQVNYGGGTYVGWAWGGFTQMSAPEIAALVTATGATITPSGIARNVAAGMSIVAWAGDGVNLRTVPHGLPKAPKMVVVKARSGAYEWPVYHASLATSHNLFLHLTNLSNDVTALSAGGVTGVDATVFTCRQGSGNINNTNALGVTYVAYCFTDIEGFSAFGSYVGNGSADGPRIILPFRPAWLMIKNVAAASNWVLLDDMREPGNVMSKVLEPNTSNAERTDYGTIIDFLANGFKCRYAGSGATNTSGNTCIYAAFARHPFGGGSVAPVPAR